MMIHENESKIKLLQQVSPLISNAEAIHGTRRANCEMKSPSIAVLPLGNLNQTREARMLAKVARTRNLSL
jgi:hypothetical protein